MMIGFQHRRRAFEILANQRKKYKHHVFSAIRRENHFFCIGSIRFFIVQIQTQKSMTMKIVMLFF